VQAFKIFTQSIEVASTRLTELSMKVYKPEVIISPRVGHIGLLQNINTDELIQAGIKEAGIKATEETLTKIKSEAHWMRRIQRKVKHRVIPEPPPGIWEKMEE